MFVKIYLIYHMLKTILKIYILYILRKRGYKLTDVKKYVIEKNKLYKGLIL